MATKNNGTSRGFYTDFYTKGGGGNAGHNAAKNTRFNKPMDRLKGDSIRAKKANGGVKVITHGRQYKEK